MIHQNLDDGEFIYFHGDDHGVVQGWVDGSEIVICEGDWLHPRLTFGGYRVDRLNDPQVLFPGGIGTSTSSESSNDSIHVLRGVFGVLVLKGRTLTNSFLPPIDIFEWDWFGYHVDDLPYTAPRSIIPLSTLTPWSSPMYRACTRSSLFGWMFVIIKTM